jgi:tRNA pseudouridine55 synthase
VRWGEERDTDDAEGRITATSPERPTPEQVQELLPRFTGMIEQVPPRFSAVKVEGARAYDLAREGETVELGSRRVEIHRLEWLSSPEPDQTILAAECGKGTYIRALARDMGRALGCYGHVAALRRTAVGPFSEVNAIRLDELERLDTSGSTEEKAVALLPVGSGLAALPALQVSPADAGRLARGQAVLLRGRDAPMMRGWVSVTAHGLLVALAEVEKGELRPRRVFNLPRR